MTQLKTKNTALVDQSKKIKEYLFKSCYHTSMILCGTSGYPNLKILKVYGKMMLSTCTIRLHYFSSKLYSKKCDGS